MKKLLIIDGQGGKMGKALIEQLKEAALPCELYAVGTNSIATSTMLKAGADYGATGENPVIACCRDADIIAGPIGIVIADALLGEITPAMAQAVSQSKAQKFLLPVNRCNIQVVGIQELLISEIVSLAARQIADACLDKK